MASPYPSYLFYSTPQYISAPSHQDPYRRSYTSSPPPQPSWNQSQPQYSSHSQELYPGCPYTSSPSRPVQQYSPQTYAPPPAPSYSPRPSYAVPASQWSRPTSPQLCYSIPVLAHVASSVLVHPTSHSIADYFSRYGEAPKPQSWEPLLSEVTSYYPQDVNFFEAGDWLGRSRKVDWYTKSAFRVGKKEKPEYRIKTTSSGGYVHDIEYSWKLLGIADKASDSCPSGDEYATDVYC